MRIAMISLNQIWEDKEANRALCEQAIRRAAKDRADLVIFPEMTLTGFSMNVPRIGEDAEHEATLSWFRDQARINHVAVVMGYVPLCSDNKGLNRAVLISAEGMDMCHYNKIHPFSVSKEDVYFRQGTRLGLCSIDSIVCGLTICYDLRFTELYQRLSSAQCSMIITIASWPKSRLLHWHTLLRARAIEHQVFMIGVNRTGSDPHGLEYEPSSCIYGPFGEVVEPVISDTAYDLCEIDLGEVKRVREKFPFLQDRFRMSEVN